MEGEIRRANGAHNLRVVHFSTPGPAEQRRGEETQEAKSLSVCVGKRSSMLHMGPHVTDIHLKPIGSLVVSIWDLMGS